jgi:hypothetical protein
VAEKESSGVQALPAEMIVNDDQFFARPAGEDFLHQRLGKQNGAFDPRGLKFLAGADVHQADGAVFSERGQVARGDLEFLILLVAGGDVAQRAASVSSGSNPQLAQPPM